MNAVLNSPILPVEHPTEKRLLPFPLTEYDLLKYRAFGYGHSFGVLSHYYGREAGLELREDVQTVLEPGMVVSMEPMLTIPTGTPGAGGYREHDILVVTEHGAENITGFPYGPKHNVIG